MTRIVSNLLELVGVASITAGVAMWSLPAALVVGGAGAVAYAWALDREVRR